MIAKEINRQSKDNFERLARYISAAEEKGEKLDKLWIAGCKAGDHHNDLDLAIKEVEATQALNTRTTKDKTYHLILSFKNDQPSHDQLKDIEESFAKVLGYEDHQRVVGTHMNTDNFHMHIAYSKIHPTKLTIHTPYQDHIKMINYCREIEKRYGLSVDNGLSKDRSQINHKARDFEAQTWQESFDTYVKSFKNELTGALSEAKKIIEDEASGDNSETKKIVEDKASGDNSEAKRKEAWQLLHNAFASHGLQLKSRGNGLIIEEISKKKKPSKKLERMKASMLDRSFSKNQLEKV